MRRASDLSGESRLCAATDAVSPSFTLGACHSLGSRGLSSKPAVRRAVRGSLVLLAVSFGLQAQSPCQFSFADPSSTASAAGSGTVLVVQRVDNLNPVRQDCPPVLEPAAPWVRLVRHAAGPGAGTEFHYRVLENFERSSRLTALRVNGAVHQIQQSAGPNQGRAPRMAVRGADGLMRMYEFSGTNVYAATGLSLASDPAVSQSDGCSVELAARDTQNRLAANVFNGCTNQWSGWRNLGGNIRGRPAVVQLPGGSVLAPVMDHTGAYFLRRYQTGQSGGDWLALGGAFISDPAAAVDATGQAYVVGKDLWNALWVGRVNVAGQFLGWVFAGGIVRGQPSIAVGTDGVAYIAARDPWGGLHMLRVKDAAVLGWARAEGEVASDPVTAATGDGMIYVAALNPLGALVYTSQAEGAPQNWGPWVDAGGNGRHVAASGIGGEALFGVVDSSSQLLWHRPATGEWRSFGVQVAGAGRAAATP